MSSTSVTISVPNHLMAGLVGPLNANLRLVEAAFPDARIVARGNEFSIEGEGADKAGKLIDELRLLAEAGQSVDPVSVLRVIDMVQHDERPSEVLTAQVLKAAKGRSVRPKTSGQKRYADAIAANVLTFGIGPAGTGKSYLAVALAVQALQAKQVERIILTRPAVEAGERLGFLPGDLMAKVDPYLRPLYDALFDMLGPDGRENLMAKGTIEVAPLAYMRGRAQPVDTPVLTPAGFRPIGSLAVGDLVIGSNGRPTPVLGVYPQGEKDVYRVTTQDGASTLASGDHLWSVTTRDGAPAEVLTTSEIIAGLEANPGRRFELPLVAPVHFESPSVRRTLSQSGDQVAIPAQSSEPQPIGVAIAPAVTLRDVLYDAPEVRLALLRELLGESSGSTFTTSSEALAADVTSLVRSLGGITYAATLDNTHVLDIRLPALGGARPMRFIDSIEPAGRAECVCIAVGAEDSLYVTSDFIVTHNTLNNSFIILDEAQNTTPEQMKMFLTRIGFGCKAVVTGDVTQVDLQGGRSGLHGLEDILTGIEGLAFVHLSHRDVVRHRIVQDIVSAYERAEQKRAKP